MKKLLTALLVAVFCLVSFSSQARADTSSDVFITALQTSNQLDYAEFYNSSESPINMKGWTIEVTITDADHSSSISICSIQLSGGWLRPQGYGIVAGQGAVTDDKNQLVYDSSQCELTGFKDPYVLKIELKQADKSLEDSIDDIPLPQTNQNQTIKQWVRRYISSASSKYKDTGDFSDDFDSASNTSRRPILLTGGWYGGPPTSTDGLQIVEILPNHKDCSPLDASLECGDYVKLYNSSNHDINLADYRLRIGYKGQNPSISNTFTWGQSLDPGSDELDLPAGQYFTLTTRNDGSLLSVPDGGDFVWLEDAYGQKIYSPVVEYPSATSTTKVGYSWAFDGQNWQWTSTPNPGGSNYFYLPPVVSNTSSGSELKPCRPDQFRNPLTNRCKKKSSASSSLKPCRSDQFRNPATNRCKSKASASSSLKPCKPNQFRNPATNRCKSKSSVGSSLKPCRPDQKRNPLTNRCRKVGQVAGAAVQKIQDIPQKTGVSWWIAGAAGASAVGYGVYEWRSEIITLSQRLLQLPKGGSR